MTPAQGWLERLASPQWTVAFFLLAAAGALLIGRAGQPATLGMAVPFTLLALNLGAAIATHRRLRADLPLLVLHLALFAMVILFVLARLTYLDAQASVTAGTAFEGRLEKVEHGPLNSGRIDDLSFINDGVRSHFNAEGKYRGSYNRVRWQGADGQWRSAEIGDNRPLVIGGYRVFSTRHRGLVPLFRWEAKGRPPEFGTVQLGDHRFVDYPPAVGWTLPNGPRVWVLVNHEAVKPLVARVEENIGVGELEHTIVVRSGEQRHVMRKGEAIDLPQGRLTYLDLSVWVGYRIVHDPMTPWLMATILVAIGSLGWFYARRMKQQESAA